MTEVPPGRATAGSESRPIGSIAVLGESIEAAAETSVRGEPTNVSPPDRATTGFGSVARSRLVSVGLIIVLLGWSLRRSVPAGSPIINTDGLPVLAHLLGGVLHPALSGPFLLLVLHSSVGTVAFAALGGTGALVIGVLGGLVLSDAAWDSRPSLLVRVLRWPLRVSLVLTRSVHELIWALLLVSVMGLDPTVAVLAIALPFGAQTAKVYAETFDNAPAGPLEALRQAGARPVAAWFYGLFPQTAPLLGSYAFYRFECAIRSAVLLGVVGIGGLGAQLVESLAARNWGQVWTLVGAVVVLSAVIDVASSRFRSSWSVGSCDDGFTGQEQGLSVDVADRPGRFRHQSWPGRKFGVLALLVAALVAAWILSGASLYGLRSVRTEQLTFQLLDELWPPQLPRGGWSALIGGVLDTLAMAVLAMAVAVVLTLVLGLLATRPRAGRGTPVREPLRWLARFVLLVLRSIPPNVWAVLVLLVLFPGVLPGAFALGLYTGGILARLSAEAWEVVDTRPLDALREAGVSPFIAGIASVLPPSALQLLSYTLYRFEICVRDTAVVGVVGAAGLGRLFQENLASFRFPAVTTLLVASVVVSAGSELFSRWARRAHH